MMKKLLMILITLFVALSATPILGEETSPSLTVTKDSKAYTPYGTKLIFDGDENDAIEGMSYDETTNTLTVESDVTCHDIAFNKDGNLIVNANLTLSGSGTASLNAKANKLYLKIEDGAVLSFAKATYGYLGNYKLYSYDYRKEFGQDVPYETELAFTKRKNGQYCLTSNSTLSPESLDYDFLLYVDGKAYKDSDEAIGLDYSNGILSFESPLEAEYLIVRKDMELIFDEDVSFKADNNTAIIAADGAKIYIDIAKDKEVSFADLNNIYEGYGPLYSAAYYETFESDEPFDTGLTYTIDANRYSLANNDTSLKTLKADFTKLEDFSGTLTKLSNDNSTFVEDGEYEVTDGFVKVSGAVETVSYKDDVYTVVIKEKSKERLYIEFLFGKIEFGKYIDWTFLDTDDATKEIDFPDSTYLSDKPEQILGSLYKDSEGKEYVSYFMTLEPVNKDLEGNYLYEPISMKFTDKNGLNKYINVVFKSAEPEEKEKEETKEEEHTSHNTYKAPDTHVG